MARDRTWTKTIEEHGIRIRLFERATGATVYLEYRREDGSKLRKSTRTGNRKEAERVARAVASELAEDRLLGRGGPVTLGQTFKVYRTHRLPDVSRDWRKLAETRIDLFTELWGSHLLVDDVSQSRVNRYIRLRMSGRLAPDHGRERKAVRVGTLDNDLRWLSSVFNFARRHKVGGKRFLSENPLHDVKWPKEENIRRPVASHSRFIDTLDYVDAVDPEGRLRCILNLARFTGRRESAICKLRASDFLRDSTAVRDALAAMGFDENRADHMPHGAIRWRADNDKQGFATVAPLGEAARAALAGYMAITPRMGDAWLFPAPKDDAKPIRRDLAGKWLLRAEKLAGLPKLQGGVWHPYRRLWATERKHLPDADVAAAGGWRDTRALKLSYQQADPATVLRVVEVGSG